MSSPAEVRPHEGHEGPDSGRVLGGRYALLEVRGRGGFATVYRATDQKLDTAVAVKLLNAAPDERVRQRFAVEVEIGSRIQHKHVVRITDCGEHEGRPYAVMPLLHGTTLWSRRGADYRQVCRWMRQYLEAMKALHEARAFAVEEHRTRLLHRDIKPTNCILSADGDLTIIDFGLVKLLDRRTRETTQGVIAGSPAYMAPECLFGEVASERSDVYSLGVSFFEMLTGERPYEGTIAELNAIHVQLRRPPSPRERRPELPIALSELVEQAMAPLPADRPATVAAMLRRLDRILRGMGDPVAAPTTRPIARPSLVIAPVALEPPPAVVQPTSGRRGRWIAGAVLQALAAVVLAVLAFAAGDDAAREIPAGPPGSGEVPAAPEPPARVEALPAIDAPYRGDPPAPAEAAAQEPTRRAARPALPTVDAAVRAQIEALRGCPQAPLGGYVSLELVVRDGRVRPRLVDFSPFKAADEWQACLARTLAGLRVAARDGSVRVRVSL